MTVSPDILARSTLGPLDSAAFFSSTGLAVLSGALVQLVKQNTSERERADKATFRFIPISRS